MNVHVALLPRDGYSFASTHDLLEAHPQYGVANKLALEHRALVDVHTAAQVHLKVFIAVVGKRDL